YNADLFDRGTIERMAAHLGTILEGAGIDASRRCSDLAAPSPEAQAELDALSAGRGSTLPEPANIGALFVSVAARCPRALAIREAQRTWSYGELAGRARAIANELRASGVGPETPVAVCLPRSGELVATLLGIVIAGGAYVPIDPGLPDARVQFVARVAGAALVVTDAATAPRLEALGLTPVTPACAFAPQVEGGFQGLDRGDALAYVTFTSGSTGQPKGVAVTHAGVARTVCDVAYAAVGSSDVVLQYAQPSFDASTFEIWGALLNGACLAIAPVDTTLDELGDFIETEGITAAWLSAGIFAELIDRRPGALRGGRNTPGGGDVLSVEHVRALREAHRECRVVNGYGPTECTTFSACHWVREVPAATESIPIGRPIEHTRVELLDRDLRPVPRGAVGEICIGGKGLARGYVGRPELTAEKFVADPRGDGERLYRTGDRGRWKSDGTLEFLGRGDRQVKLRGFRIELDEVELVLAAHPLARQVAVVAHSESDRRGGARASGKRLVAYVTSDHALDSGELRAWSLERLPGYMVPSAFVQLARLPLGANGKIDRRALNAPDAPAARSAAASTALEMAIAQAMGDVLGAPPLGRDDHFFELGGHSLAAMRAISKIRDVLGVPVPLRWVFECPTVAELSVRLERAQRGGDAGRGLDVVPAGARAGRSTELQPTSFGQRRLWIIDQLDQGLATYNVPLVAR